MPDETKSSWCNLLLAASEVSEVNFDLYFEWIQTIASSTEQKKKKTIVFINSGKVQNYISEADKFLNLI